VLCAAIVHPVNSAGSFQGREPAAPFVINGSYLEPCEILDVVDRDGIRMTFHGIHRPLAAYSRALEDAGMLIEAIREVSPARDQPVADPAALRWARVPLFLHLRAVKP
jgi:hypothetical protein